MSELTDFAWAAGVIDGEGSIYLESDCLGGYRLALVVVQAGLTEPAMLTRFVALFGGSISRRAPSRSALHRPVFVWATKTANAERVLRAVAPYVVQKRDQVELALASRGEGADRAAIFRRLKELKRL